MPRPLAKQAETLARSKRTALPARQQVERMIYKEKKKKINTATPPPRRKQTAPTEG